MEKKIGVIVLLVLILGGLGYWMMAKKSAPVVTNQVETEKVLVSVVKGSLWMNVGNRRISMVSLKLDGAKTFTENKEVFNSVMVNKLDDSGKLEIVLGVMKATTELPTGKVLVGKLGDGEKMSTVSGTVTVAGVGSESPYDMEVTK